MIATIMSEMNRTCVYWSKEGEEWPLNLIRMHLNSRIQDTNL